MTTYNGIDVSCWNGDIDFDKVRLSGVDFVIIKAGGSDDSYYKDSYFETNYKKAKKAGLKVGCYFFVGSDFTTIEKGHENAIYFSNLIRGKQFDYPIYLDLESTSPTQKQGATQASIAFCNYLEDLGYYVGIYASSVSGFIDRLDTSKLTQFDKWVAQYDFERPNTPTHKIWQYSSTGNVSGVNGNVDKNISYYNFTSNIHKNNTENKENNTENKGNENIKEVQKWINNYRKIDIDGIFGCETKKGLIVALQTELNKQFNANLVIDGIFGNATKSKCVEVGLYAEGNITRVIQGYLICNGFSTNGFDGIFGETTKMSVMLFQKNHLLTVDGVVGANTFNCMFGG